MANESREQGQVVEKRIRYSEPGLYDYFMSVALLTGLRSDDSSAKVGACIVNQEEKIVGLGYNRFPKISPNCGEKYPVSRNVDTLGQLFNSKYPYILYAEMDAIMNKTCLSLKDCTMYTLIFPWNECAKLIVESGIKKVIYYSDKFNKSPFIKASEIILQRAGVKLEKFIPEKEENRSHMEYLAMKTVEIPNAN